MFHSGLYIVLGILLFIATAAFWLQFIGLPDGLQWQQHIPLFSIPSAIVGFISFKTIGAWLYYKRFYKELYNFIGNFQAFKLAKKIIWGVITTITLSLLYACLWIANLAVNLWHNFPDLATMVLPILFIGFCAWITIAYLIYPRKPIDMG